jgi:hypothetical protein
MPLVLLLLLLVTVTVDHCCSARTFYPSIDQINVNFSEYKLRSFALRLHLQYKTVVSHVINTLANVKYYLKYTTPMRKYRLSVTSVYYV